MVLGVCRAVMRDQHDAEDACQATFLVLAAQSRTGSGGGFGGELALWRGARVAVPRPVARRPGVAGWSAPARQRVRVTEWVSQPPAEPWPELYVELDRLPEPFRAAVVLCDLEGHSYEQAARILHLPSWHAPEPAGAEDVERLRNRLEQRPRARARPSSSPASGAGPAAPLATAALSPQLVTSIAATAIDTIARRAIAGATHAAGRCRDRRQIIVRVVTGLTASMLTGLIAATTIGLALARRNVDHSEPQQSVEAKRRADVGPIPRPRG